VFLDSVPPPSSVSPPPRDFLRPLRPLSFPSSRGTGAFPLERGFADFHTPSSCWAPGRHNHSFIPSRASRSQLSLNPTPPPFPLGTCYSDGPPVVLPCRSTIDPHSIRFWVTDTYRLTANSSGLMMFPIIAVFRPASSPNLGWTWISCPSLPVILPGAWLVCFSLDHEAP